MSRLLNFAAATALTVTLGAGAAAAQDFRALAREDLQRAHDELAALRRELATDIRHPWRALGRAFRGSSTGPR